MERAQEQLPDEGRGGGGPSINLDLQFVLDRLKLTSVELLETALPIMQEMEDVDNDGVDVLVEHNRKLSEEVALELLQDVTLEMIEDAKQVNKEIEEFSVIVMSLEDEAELESVNTPFLNQVWSGDIYDANEINGLEALADDLQTQLDNMDLQKIVHRALEKSVGVNSEEEVKN